MTYHLPVLQKESVDYLITDPDGVYVDATFGAGGHATEILNRLSDRGKLIAFDQDADAIKNLKKIPDERLIFLPSNFRHINAWCKYLNIEKVQGVLADLGVSSHQLDKMSRGFSFRGEARLDMRMNSEAAMNAVTVLNTYSAEELQNVFGSYGEVRNAKTLALEIVERRKSAKITEVKELLHILEPLVRGKRVRYLSQVFQALRIEVNDELGALQDLLRASVELIEKDGVLAVLSYHSLEDRIVKRFIRNGIVGKECLETNMYKTPFAKIKGSPIRPEKKEIETNNRARSAMLRVAKRR